MRHCVALLCCCALVVYGCERHEADPSAEQRRILDEARRRQAELDSLRSEVRTLTDVVRRSNDVELPDTLYFSGERVPVERWWVRAELEEAFRFYTGFARNRKRIEMYLRETKFYFPYITERLREASLPEDLKYVPVAESELNNRARSPQEAVGLWQLMMSTGRERSLQITAYIDERRDFERATEAAIAKLQSDHAELGDWFLTLAAYNAGLGRVKRALADESDSSYFNLILPAETMEYGYRMIALKYILEHPARYGFSRGPAQSRAINVIQHSVKEASTLTELARCFNIPAREFQLLNPQFTSHTVPPGIYRLKVPLEPFAPQRPSGVNFSLLDSTQGVPSSHQ